MRKIVIGYLNGTEQGYMSGWESKEFSGPIEILEVYNDNFDGIDDSIIEIGALVVKSDCGWVIEEWKEWMNLPDIEICTSTYKEMCNDIVDKADKHWICEMYALLVSSRDTARCEMIPWNFQFGDK